MWFFDNVGKTRRFPCVGQFFLPPHSNSDASGALDNQFVPVGKIFGARLSLHVGQVWHDSRFTVMVTTLSVFEAFNHISFLSALRSV